MKVDVDVEGVKKLKIAFELEKGKGAAFLSPVLKPPISYKKAEDGRVGLQLRSRTDFKINLAERWTSGGSEFNFFQIPRIYSSTKKFQLSD
ncbi:hypothetical protein L1N85_22295 [Paenibacillus alkaliterrae]|nr:hypothetical protein [Paenibacillus alkaliterrae]